MSNKAKFWVGVALTIPVMIVSSLVAGAGSALVDAVSGSGSSAGAIAGSAISVALFALFIAAIVIERTRWFALGVLAGTGVLLILAAGACVVLIVALTQSYN